MANIESDHTLAMAETSSKSDVDTLDSNSYGRQLEEIRIANTPADTFQTGVDVTTAEKDFSELSKQFSSISHQAQRLSRQESRVSKGVTSKDIEKAEGSTASDDTWDLETTLRGDRAASEEAGIKDKHIGWWNLTLRERTNTDCPRCDLGQPDCSWNGRRQDIYQNIPRCNHRFPQSTRNTH
jgi:hypothetical protein